MRNDLGCRDRPEPSGRRQVVTTRQTEQETGREEIAGPRGVENVLDRFGIDLHDLVTSDDRRSERPARDDRERTVATDRGDRGFEVLGFVERAEFVLVREENVDLVLDERTEVVAMAVDAEAVGQRERHLPPGAMGDARGVTKGLLRVVAIEEIALHVEHPSGGDHTLVDVDRPQVGRHSEIGVHRPLSIGCHDDDAAPGRNAIEVSPGGEMNTDGTQVVPEHVTEIIGTDLPDVGRRTPETGHTTHGVGCRATAHLDGGPECSVQMQRPIGVDESHGSLDESLLLDEIVVSWRDHVDECIADTHDVEPRSIGTGRKSSVRSRHDRQPYFATTLADVTATSAARTGELDPHRLPRHVVPHRYELELEPDLASATFTGRVVITAEATTVTRSIVLNSADLEVQRVFVDGQPAPFSLDDATERLHIGTLSDVQPGTVAIDIEFTGILNDKLRGFYRSTYRDADGVEHVIGCTQMQATDCRRAFPCFDEPDFKAVFSITLVVDDGLLAVSNGPETRRDDRDGKTAIVFADTMPMSTYLVAFVVGRLEATEAVDVGGVPMRIVHVPGKAHLTEFGLDVGAASLRWFTEYYGIPYADAKIDMVALPDFAAGAMENVGCITYRENLLLVDPATSTQVEKELVADVVSHELAHMWFGDLVTMKWWNGIWLNEAFATFMEVAAVDAYRPDWKRWTSFSLERSVAFETDSLVTTRPVEYEVHSPADCDGMFDVLTYQKGGALLRMLEQYLGVDRFRAGVRHYLNAHSYGNTETSDLWDAIEIAVAQDGGEPVRELMDSWIWQPGYPLVSATLGGASLRLTQQRFLFDTEAEVPDQVWLVPIHVRIGSTDHRILLHDSPVELPIGGEPVIVNAGGHGFYRVAYSPELLARIDRSVLATLSTIERYNLVDDAWSAVVSGRLTSIDFLAFLSAFVDERELAVWQVVANGLRSLGRLVDDTTYPKLQSRILDLANPALDDLGWEPDDDEDELVGKLRGLLVTLVAANGNDPSAIDRCRRLLTDAQQDPASVHPELTAAATTVVAAHGDQDTYDDMQARFLRADNPQEQLRYLYALAEFDSADLVRRTCEFAVSGSVKTQNAPFLLARCIMHRKHGRIAWDFVRRNWGHANDKFPSNTIVRMIDPVKSLNTPEVETDVQAFFAEHPIPQAAKTLEQILERQRVNVALREREQAPLEAHLHQPT